MIANYHTHTYRCRHASGTDREYVEAAIKGGFKTLGFSDHVPYLHEKLDRVRMQPEEMEGYVNSILELKREYQEEIAIFLGLEMEYLPEHFEKMRDFLKGFPLDYVILGHHFVGNHFSTAGTNDKEILELYCRQVMEAMESGYFTYVAHPDVFCFNGKTDVWEDKMREICRKAKNCRIPLEINFHGMVAKMYYPNEAFWKIAGEEGCPVIYGCDAHEPHELSEYASQLEKAQKLSERYGLKVINDVKLKTPHYTK